MKLADLINSTYTDADARAASGDYLDIGESNDSEVTVANNEPCQVFDVPTGDSRCSFKYFEDGARCVVDALTVKVGTSREHIHLSQVVAAVCKYEDGVYSPVDTRRVLGVSVPAYLFNDKSKREQLQAELPKENGFTPEVVENEADDLEFNKLMGRLELDLVRKMCGKLNDNSMLLKDGPLPNGEDPKDWQFIVGVCKSFQESLKDDHIERIIRSLGENQRSGIFHGNGKTYWFLRLRKGYPEMPFKETIRCEICGELGPERIDVVDGISAAILRLKYPVCYGYDDRWRNHLYPVSITERYCKSQYINKETFKNLFGL